GAATERSGRTEWGAEVIGAGLLDAGEGARLGAAAAPVAVGPAGLEHLAVALLRPRVAGPAVVGDPAFDAALRAGFGQHQPGALRVAHEAILRAHTAALAGNACGAAIRRALAEAAEGPRMDVRRPARVFRPALKLRVARHRAGAPELVRLANGAVVRARAFPLEAAELAGLLAGVAEPVRRALPRRRCVLVAFDDTGDLTRRAIPVRVLGGDARVTQG